jgi:hypothetical protein
MQLEDVYFVLKIIAKGTTIATTTKISKAIKMPYFIV